MCRKFFDISRPAQRDWSPKDEQNFVGNINPPPADYHNQRTFKQAPRLRSGQGGKMHCLEVIYYRNELTAQGKKVRWGANIQVSLPKRRTLQTEDKEGATAHPEEIVVEAGTTSK